MEYKLYTICPSFETAQANLQVIRTLMLEDGILDNITTINWDIPHKVGNGIEGNGDTTQYYYTTPDEEYASQVQAYVQSHDDPKLFDVYNFNIYKHLTATAREKFPDPSIVPHSVDYKIDVSPNFHQQKVFEFGFLVNTVLHYWDGDLSQSIHEIARIVEQYTVKDNSRYHSTKTIDRRLKKRDWTTVDGLYIEGLSKITTKIYDAVIDQRREGRIRRDNIFTFLSKDYFALRQFQLGESEDQVEVAAFGFLKKYSSLKADFIEGSWAIIQYVEEDDDPFLNMIMQDNLIPTPQGSFPMSAIYPSFFPELVNNDISPYIGQPVKNRILDHLKGLV